MSKDDDNITDDSDVEYCSDGRIVVYIIAPHPYDVDYDEFLTDDVYIALGAAQDAIENIFDRGLEDGVKGHLTITQTKMSRGEYEMITEDYE